MREDINKWHCGIRAGTSKNRSEILKSENMDGKCRYVKLKRRSHKAVTHGSMAKAGQIL